MKKKLLEATNISKRFSMTGGYSTLASKIQEKLAGSRGAGSEGHWVLDGVSFCVGAGECLGVVGSNGSGKSTLLRILAGISQPDRGSVKRSNRLCALIEVLGGLHPELTGEESVFVFGSMCGFRRREIQKALPDIVEFAEIGPVFHHPLKRFSTGSLLRLNFSTVVHLKPDVLLLDEILSVADEPFQERARQRLQKEVDAGMGLVIVSHEFEEISRLCHRVLWIERGEPKALDSAEIVIAQFREFHLAMASGRRGESKNPNAIRI